jgi:hypothetical protein
MMPTGTLAPEWTIDEALCGETPPTPQAFGGRPLLLLFFNVGCAGCTGRAVPYTLELRERYPDLQIAAIHSSFSQSSTYPASQVRAVLDYFRVPYPVYQDAGSTTFDRYAAEGTPHWIVIDGAGRVHRSVFGSMEGAIQRLEYILLEMFQG